MDATGFKKLILKQLNEFLKPHAYKKRGNCFSKDAGDIEYRLIFQSYKSTKIEARITINIELASSKLYSAEDVSLSFEDTVHFHKRIGFYMSDPHDKWWILKDTLTTQEAGAEIIEILNTKVLAEISRIKRLEDFIDLWEQGISPGLTKKNANEYLELARKLI